MQWPLTVMLAGLPIIAGILSLIYWDLRRQIASLRKQSKKVVFVILEMRGEQTAERAASIAATLKEILEGGNGG